MVALNAPAEEPDEGPSERLLVGLSFCRRLRAEVYRPGTLHCPDFGPLTRPL